MWNLGKNKPRPPNQHQMEAEEISRLKVLVTHPNTWGSPFLLSVKLAYVLLVLKQCQLQGFPEHIWFGGSGMDYLNTFIAQHTRLLSRLLQKSLLFYRTLIILFFTHCWSVPHLFSRAEACCCLTGSINCLKIKEGLHSALDLLTSILQFPSKTLMFHFPCEFLWEREMKFVLRRHVRTHKFYPLYRQTQKCHINSGAVWSSWWSVFKVAAKTNYRKAFKSPKSWGWTTLNLFRTTETTAYLEEPSNLMSRFPSSVREGGEVVCFDWLHLR